MLNPTQIGIVKSTAPLVEAHAREITEHFYPLMFERYPEVQSYFNQTHQNSGAQRQALANAVIAYAKNIDRLAALGPAVSTIINKHVSLNIQPEHYPIVGECLLESIAVILGDAITEDIALAWTLAYQQLAQLLIDAEVELYQHNKDRSGGWNGDKPFTVVAKVEESEVITSFYLQPKDTTEVIDFEAGQYVCVITNVGGQPLRRNYSLSDAPGKNTLRISVKREPNGVMSNHLHDDVHVGDSLSLTAPSGNFTLKHSDKPLFLVTGGVGITPAISMLNSSLNSGRPITFIHAAINGQHHAFNEHVKELAALHSKLRFVTIYSSPNNRDACDHKGFVTHEILESLLPDDGDVEFYFLGPAPFMKAVNQIAHALEIPDSQIHYEFFGPLEDLSAGAEAIKNSEAESV